MKIKEWDINDFSYIAKHCDNNVSFELSFDINKNSNDDCIIFDFNGEIITIPKELLFYLLNVKNYKVTKTSISESEIDTIPEPIKFNT